MGRLLARAATAGFGGGGCDVMSVVCLGYCLPGLRGWVVKPQNIRRPGHAVYEPGMGAPPPRVAALGLGRQRQHAESAAPEVGKVPGAGVPAGRPDPVRDLHPKSVSVCPGSPRRCGSPEGMLPASPPAALGGSCGSPRPERSTPRESRASAPAGSSAPERPRRAETAQPYPRGRLRGLPQGHAERPDRPGWERGAGGAPTRLRGGCRLSSSALPSQPCL